MAILCSSIIKVTGSKANIEAFVSHIKSEESDFDFDNVITAPSHLYVQNDEQSKRAYAFYYGNPEDEPEGYQDNENGKKIADTYDFNKRNFGCTNIHSWRQKHWGTRLVPSYVSVDPIKEVINANGLKKYEVVCELETGWSLPIGIFNRLGREYPDLLFNIKVDEEAGRYWGEITIEQGILIKYLQKGYRPDGPYSYMED